MTLHLRPSNSDDATDASFRVKPDGELDPAGEAGWFLQRERERRGKTLADAALETRINAKYLHALEHGLLSNLPNRSYVLGYVRVYAEFLGLEADPLVDHYKGLLPTQETYRKQNRKRGMSAAAGFMAAASVFILALTAAVWYMAPDLLGGGARQTAERQTDADRLPTGSIPTNRNAATQTDIESQRLDQAVPTVRVQRRGLSDVDDQNSASRSADSLQPEDKAPVGGNSEGAEETDGLTEFIRQHVSEAQSPGEADAALPAGKTFGDENDGARVVLLAKQPVWIRIEDAQGNVVVTRTLAQGDAYKVPNRDGLVLIARDGGALEYSIDGRSKGTIGASGEIVVGRSLDVDRLDRAGG